MTLTIGVDVGGTKVAAGVVDDDGVILQRELRETPSTDANEIEDTIAEVVSELRKNHDVKAVGIGAAGFIDIERAVVLFASNLAWRNEPLRDEVAKRVSLPVMIENDANAAAWAELRFGAGRGLAELVLVTIGTGIGAGIIRDGALYGGEFGIAAEMGHTQVVPDGLPCGCGEQGCWEQYGSGRALVREAQEIASADPASAAQLLAFGDGTPAGITGPHVTQAALHGDVASVEALRRVGHWVGIGLVNVALTLDPGTFVVGGGVSEAGELLLGPARTAYQERLPGAAYRPMADIRQARFGNEAGLIGAADLARLRRA
jgi:glucokinase